MNSKNFLSIALFSLLTLSASISTASDYDASDEQESSPCDSNYDNLRFSRSAQQKKQACRDLKMNKCTMYFGKGSAESKLISKKCGRLGQLRGKVSKINPLKGAFRG